MRSAHAVAALAALLSAPLAGAHTGPPFPIVEQHAAGPYRVALWTDPDATDDGSAGGQFWIVVARADGAAPQGPLSASLTARGPGGSSRSAAGAPTAHDPATLFVRVPLDREGPWQVEVALDGPAGRASFAAAVEATYDTRPPPVLLVVYALPFVAVALVWLRAVRGRRARPGKAAPATIP